MEEAQKLIRNKIHQLLGWGTAAFLLVGGFALNQPELFEMNNPPYYDELRCSREMYATQLSNSSDSTLEERLRKRVEALELGRAIKEEENKITAARVRALVLIIAILAFAVTWPILLYLLYKEPYLGDKATPTRSIALAYSIVVGLVTLCVAITVTIL